MGVEPAVVDARRAEAAVAAAATAKAAEEKAKADKEAALAAAKQRFLERQKERRS